MIRLTQYRKVLFLITGFSIVIFGCAHNKALETLSVEGGYEVTYSAELTVKVETPAEDFVLYRFYRSSEQLLLVLYIGNHPSSENELASMKQCENLMLPEMSAKCGIGKHENTNHVYTRLSRQGWPQYAYFTYQAETLKDTELIHDILFSFVNDKQQK